MITGDFAFYGNIMGILSSVHSSSKTFVPVFVCKQHWWCIYIINICINILCKLSVMLLLCQTKHYVVWLQQQFHRTFSIVCSTPQTELCICAPFLYELHAFLQRGTCFLHRTSILMALAFFLEQGPPWLSDMADVLAGDGLVSTRWLSTSYI